MKTTISLPLSDSLKILVVVAIAWFGINEVRAASATWITTSGSADWTNASNWSPAAVPGGAGTETNMDIATFSTTLTSPLTVTVGPSRNVGGLIFSDTSTNAINITNGQLWLSSGGVIENTATSGGRNVDFNATVYVRGSSATATITSDSTNASGRFRLNNGLNASNSATITLNGANIGYNSVGNIVGAVAIIKDGAGYWGLNGNSSTFTGGLTLNAGTLGFNGSGSSFGTGTLTINGGTLKSDNAAAATINTNAIVVGGNFAVADGTPNAYDVTFSGAMNLGGATRTITASTVGTSVFAFSGVISNGGLTKDGAGALTLKGNNTYTGDTTVTAGTLALGGSGSLSTNTAVAISNGATFDVGGRSQEIAGLRGAGRVTNSSGTLTVNKASSMDTFSGAIVGAGGLAKAGSGTLSLTGTNTYSGDTVVGGGTLQLNSASGAALSSTASVTVTNGATLLISQSDQVKDAASITLSGGTIKRGSGVSETMGNLILTEASTLDYGAGATGTLQFGAYTPSSLLTVSSFLEGNKLVFGNSLTAAELSAYFSFDNAFTTNSSSGLFTITAIPEASTIVAALGLVGLFLWPTRRRRLWRAKVTKPLCREAGKILDNKSNINQSKQTL